MKTRTRQWFRSVALGCAMAAGTTAFGDFYDWKTDEKGYWEDETSWEAVSADFTDYRIGNHGSEIGFRSLVEADDANAVLVYNGEHTFVADEESVGLKKANAPLNVSAPWWYTGTPILNVAKGSYEFASVNLNSDATYGGSTTVNLNGGTLTTAFASIGSGCALTLNGGTLVLGGGVTGSGSLAVGENGGTVETAEAQTISTAVTGSGTLTKTGAGALAITGDVSAFTGSITVAEGAGSVTVGEGEGAIVIAAGETKSFAPDTTYYWTGEAGDDLWATPGNWLVGNAVPTAPPAADSVVVIPEGDGTLTIKCAFATDYTGYLTINRDVTLARAQPSNTSGPNGINITKVEGTGTLTLAGGYRASSDATQDRFHVRRGASNLPFEIDVDLNTTGRVRFMDPNGVPRLTLNGALKGDGIIYFDNHSNGEGIIFNGDTSAFTGSYSGCGAASWAREGTKFGGDARGSASASWSFGCWEGGDRGVYGYTPFLVNDVTYQFGQLNAPKLHFWRGYTGSNTTGATIEVGALANKTSTVAGSLAPNNTLRKVGATSTLEYTNSGTANGTVEAYEGTTVIKGTATGFALKFAGNGATIKIARSTTTTTEVDSGVEDDPETTDVDESKTTTTTTTANIPAAFVPGFVDELAGGQYEVAQDVVEGVTYDVYTVVKVAKDSTDAEYYSVAAAITALAEAENKTITLTHAYDTVIALPLGYTLDTAGYACTVTGASGVGVVENDGVWTTVDNSAATWQGDAAGANWADAANWSTGVVPGDGTAVTFNYDAIVYISDHDNLAHKCSTIKLKDGISVEFAPTDHNQDLYPRIAIYGENVWGNATLKLYRCGLYNAHGSRIKIFPRVLFENKGVNFDSWVQNGSFEFAREVTGTGMFVCYNACQFDAGITVEGDNIVDCRATPTFGQNATLNGDGTLICYNGMPGAHLSDALKNSDRWTGTFYLKNTTHTTVTWLSSLGNSNSKVLFDNVTTYLFTSLREDGNHAVGEMEIGAGGFKVNGTYSGGDFVFPAKLTGTGTFTVGIAGNNVKNVQFTGDCSEFAGTIEWASDTVNTRVVVGDDTSAEFAEKTIVVNEGSTLGLGGFSGTLVGGGTVYGPTYPQTVGTFDAAKWTGEFVIGWTINGGELNLDRYGTANSTVVLGTDMTAGWMTVTSFKPTLRLDANMTINNGSSNSTTTFPEITGTGNLAFTARLGGVPTFAITKFSDYRGTLSTAGNSAVTIGTVNVREFVVGEPVVKLAANANLTTDPADITFTVDGEAKDFDLMKVDDGNLYVAVAAVTVTPAEGDPVTTNFATYEEAAAFADDNSVTSFAVLAGDGVINGWDYDNGTLTKNTTAIARVGATQYDTLAAAFEAAGVNDTVVLFGTSAEAVTLGSGQTLEIAETAVYTGTLSGSGTVDAYVATTPAGFSNWTGTFVVNWDLSGTATAKAAVILDKYGVSGSSVRVMKALENFYFRHKDKANSADVKPAVYFEDDVTQNDGYTYNYNGGLATIFSQVGMAAGKTFTTRGAGGNGNKYIFTKLSGFEGTLNVRSTDIVEINGVEVAEMPAVGTKVVNATVAATASVTAKIADGYPLVVKEDGLYFDPVAQVGEAYYNTATEAIDAASGAVVSLVKSADNETYTLAANQTVKVNYNGFGGLTVQAPEGAYIFTQSWDEETSTGTYTCRAAAASASIGGVVSYYSQVQEAYNAVTTNGTIGDSFTVLDGSFSAPLDGFSYDAETHTYTMVLTVAKYTAGVTTYKFETLAAACAAAEKELSIPTVELLVARDTLNETIPDGWEYNTPEASGTDFGTLTKVVPSGDIEVDTDGCDFTVDAATAAAITTATGVATTDPNFGKAAIAYVVGGELEDGEVVIPTPTITVADGKATVVYSGDNPHVGDYTVTCTLWSFALADANDSTKWTPVATGGIGANLVDTDATAASKFYKVTVTVTNSQLGNETDSGEGA